VPWLFGSYCITAGFGSRGSGLISVIASSPRAPRLPAGFLHKWF
jgi:hypothetical protein